MTALRPAELRLGNLIDKYGKPTVVDWGILQKIENGSVIYKPIPLTENWLLKSGFRYVTEYIEKYDGFAYVLDLGCIIIGTGIMGGDIIIFDSEGKSTGKIIKYVHELQNLYFALKNKELQLNPAAEQTEPTNKNQ